MSWWNPSWLLNLPSIDFSLPSGIQRRFLSFLLNRLLGRFVKPGQLDVQNIDSQIGSGYVQVKDVELDPAAIDPFLVGLPLQLHHGFVSDATARIPWPNPLTSSLGLSINSLRLVFHIVPSHLSQVQPPVSDLAESVASVAETFLHQELRPGEEASLRDSFHSDLASSTNFIREQIPGSLDPFLSGEEQAPGDSDPDGVSIFASLIESLLARFSFDARDTQITLVNPGQTSYTLTIPEIRYATEHKNTAGETMQPGNDKSVPPEQDLLGVTRTIIISGLHVTCRDIRLRTSSPTSPTSPSGRSSGLTLSELPPPSKRGPPQQQQQLSRSTSPLSSSSHSDSDIDEETQILMSQSVADLPPRTGKLSSPSLSTSIASSMYHSAVTTVEPSATSVRGFAVESAQNYVPVVTIATSLSHVDKGREQQSSSNPDLPDLFLEGESSPLLDDIILSFGSDPIVIRLSTPPPISKAPGSVSTPGAKRENPNPENTWHMDTFKLTVSAGIIGVAARAWHLRGLLDILQAWDACSRGLGSKNTPTGPLLLPRLNATVKIKGFVILLLPSNSCQKVNTPGRDAGLARFFEHPLTPPRFPHGYVRVHVDGCYASMSAPQHPSTVSLSRQSSGVPSQNNAETLNMSLSITDVSIFAFSTEHASDSSLTQEYYAAPILVTDSNLPLQYSAKHMQLFGRDSSVRSLSFSIIDWTHPSHRTSNAKSSQWRTKLPQQRLPKQTSASDRSAYGHASRSHLSAITASMKLISASRSTTAKEVVNSHVQAEVTTIPFHLFVDLGSLLSGGDAGLLGFINELMISSVSSSRAQSQFENSDEELHGDNDSTPPATPRASHPAGTHQQQRDRERERERIERLVLEDLDLALDYRPQPLVQNSYKITSWRKDETASEEENKLQLTLKLPMVRVEVRCPPPLHASEPRSGSFVLDLHNIHIFPGISSQMRKSAARFADNDLADEPVSHIQETQAHVILSLELRRMVVAYALYGETNASAIISLAPSSSPSQHELMSADFGASPSSADTVLPKPQSNSHVIISQSAHGASASRPSGTVITIDVPCVHVHLEKPIFDGLQLWADDIRQLLEHILSDGTRDTDAERFNSRDTSIIGSRFFAKSSHGSVSDTGSVSNKSHAGETILKVTISKAFSRIDLPRDTEPPGTARPFDLLVSDLDCLLEVKPEGKDETVVTLGLMDLSILDSLNSGDVFSLLASTNNHSPRSNLIPLVKLRFASLVVPGTIAKESRIKLSLHGCTYNLFADFSWTADIGRFFKAPPGAFESVIPSECTKVAIKVTDGSIVAKVPDHPGVLVVHMGETTFSTDIVGDAPESIFNLSVPDLSLLFVDDQQTGLQVKESEATTPIEAQGADHWMAKGYAILAEISNLAMRYTYSSIVNDTKVNIDHAGLKMHLCADTMSALTSFVSHLSPPTKPPGDDKSVSLRRHREPTTISIPTQSTYGLMNSLDEQAFKRLPEVGAAPDMINDDLPSNPDYLDASFGTAAGFRELRDEDLDEFDVEDIPVSAASQTGVISIVGGETIRISSEDGIDIVENYFNQLPLDSADESSQFGETSMRVRLHSLDFTVLLYDGYDWIRTRKIIEDQVKIMRRRLEKIRQLLASGQTHDPDVEDTSALLFNSVYIGLEQNVEDMEPDALIAAIDNELDDDFETASRSSWQSLRPSSLHPSGKTKSLSGQSRIKHFLRRSRNPCMEFRLMSTNAEIDTYRPQEPLAGRALVTIGDFEILDHIRTSTWKTFLTELRSDSRGNIRETESNMVRIELRSVKPVPGNSSVESRLRAKFLPLRLHVDQDALDFLKKFFNFKDSQVETAASDNSSDDEIYFQQAEVFPVDIKLDYKPRRVDYRALREGRTIELMNFFHFDGAEMTLRHITLSGVTGWPRLFDLLNDLWTPDVKATQLVDVISGVSPIRSVVNVGSGVADLVLLPIAQYKKDGRVLRGVQKGATSFVKSTAMEAIKLGARLATGTQVILEQAENVLGTQFKDSITAEALQYSPSGLGGSQIGLTGENEEETRDLISKYAEQPQDVKEGLQSAYKSLRRNMNSAAQTILAVPMEVYERSSNEGPVRAVIRAVPIAVLKPMIGASEAVSKTLFGIHNSLDPSVRHDIEAKYKHR